MHELSEAAKNAISSGSIKVRVTRSGMFQQLTFIVRKSRLGDVEYTELYTERQIDMSELVRIANSIGLPVKAQNAEAFPAGTSAADFRNL
jgi:hypothetical protein